MEAQRDAVVALQREVQAVEQRIRKAEGDLEQKRYHLQCEADALEGEARDLERYEQEIAAIGAERDQLQDPQARRLSLSEQRWQADERLSDLKVQRAGLRVEDERLAKRQEALRALSGGAVCDYCGQPLPPEQQRAAMGEAAQQREEIAALVVQITEQGRDGKRRADDLRQQEERAQQDLQTLSRLEARLGQANQERLRMAARQDTLPDIRRRLDAQIRQIRERDFAHADQELLVTLSAQLERQERVGEQIAEARERLKQLQNAEREYLQLERAQEVMATEPTRAEELALLIGKREAQIERGAADDRRP